jgi:FAD/FMN-containing dehydrogenase
VGSDHVKSDPDTISDYAVDGMMPWAVVYPSDTEQVSDVVRLAHAEKLAVVPWGSGSKMFMGNAPSHLDLVVCTKRLNRVVDMDTANLTVTVQAGVRFKDIQSSLSLEENRCYLPQEDSVTVSDETVCSDRENKGCFIPMMPLHSHSATMGGIIAANSSGPTRLLYGLPRDMVLGVRYVDPNGEIIGLGGKTVKNVAGYDMCKLMIGSQGSLGILCEITLRLLPVPEHLGTCVLAFPGLGEASRFVDQVFETNLLPAAVELLNSKAYELLAPQDAKEGDNSGYTVAVALEGFEEAVHRMASEIRQMASASGAKNNMYLKDDEHRVFWDTYCNLVHGLSVDYPDLVSLKLTYPISSYLEVMEMLESLRSDLQLEYALQAHTGSGITRIHILFNPGNVHSGDHVVKLVDRLLEGCQRIGGNLVVERGGPQLKQRLPVWGMSQEDLTVMKRIKQHMDPSGLFCPGRFVGGI